MHVLTGCVIVALFWGATNPFLKRHSEGLPGRGPLSDLLFLFSRPLFAFALALNGVGSLLFYYLLSDSQLALVSPLCNGLTFASTAAAGVLFFAERISPRRLLGVLLVAAGALVMVM